MAWDDITTREMMDLQNNSVQIWRKPRTGHLSCDAHLLYQGDLFLNFQIPNTGYEKTPENHGFLQVADIEFSNEKENLNNETLKPLISEFSDLDLLLQTQEYGDA